MTAASRPFVLWDSEEVRRFLLALILLTVWPVAPADAIDRRVDAGLALAGDAVLWGEEHQDGSLTIVRQAPGQPAKVIESVPPPRGVNAIQGFTGLPGSLTASSKRIAYGLSEGTARSDGGGDSGSSTQTARTLVSSAGGAFTDAFPGCRHGVLSTDVDEDAVAVAQSFGSCDGQGASASVWLQEGSTPARVVSAAANPEAFLGSVHLAGPYVAWSEGPSGRSFTKLTVVDRATSAIVAELAPTDFGGGRNIESFDIDAEGNIAAILPTARGERRHAVVLNLADRSATVLSRRASYIDIALAGGRVAFTTARSFWTERLVVTDLRGMKARTLMRFRRRDLQPTVGRQIALTSRRVAWSFVRNPTGDPTQPGRSGIRNIALP